MSRLIWPLLFAGGVSLVFSLIFYVQWRRRVQAHWKISSAQFPPGELPSSISLTGFILLPLLLWAALSWAWILATQLNTTPLLPEVSVRNQEDNYQQKEVVFLVDTSRSMLVPDSWHGRTRLARSKEIVERVIEKLNGEHVALFGFATEPFQLVPITPDHFFTRLIARNLQINENGSGTDLTNLLVDLRERYGKRASQLATDTLIVLISDGGDTEWEKMGAEQREKQKIVLTELFQHLNRYPVRLMTVGVGSPAGGIIPGVEFEGKPVHSQLQEPLMRLIGSLGKGGYLYADRQDVDQVANQILDVLEKPQLFSNTQKKAKDQLVIPSENFWRAPLALSLGLLLFKLLFPLARRYPFKKKQPFDNKIFTKSSS